VGIAVYGARHLQALLGSLGRLARNPFATLLTVFVIALALALPLALELLVTNARAATGGFANALDVSVYFKTDAPLAKIRELAHAAGQRPGVAEVTVITSADALREFRQYSGFGAALSTLQDNPLPNVLHVRPAADASSPAALDALKRYFAAWPEVDIVQIDSDWVLRLNAILDLARRLLLATAALLGLGVLAVIGNTIRLEIQNRRAEIEVVKLVGGSNGFVRRPFLYTGALYGLLGALLAWLIVGGTVLGLTPPAAELARLYGSHYVLTGPTFRDVGALLAAGAGLGWLGAWISAARHLRRIQPRA
jgi:cell division transport system permease protein